VPGVVSRITAGRPVRAARYTPVPRVLGDGADRLRMLHDALPVDSCPWVRTDFGDAPPVDRLVVCHGDACAPNTVIDAHGGCCGHVDLGALAVADRWADLAIATLSLAWNYATAHQAHLEDDLLEPYGIDRDGVRIDYYRRLWQAPDHGGG
jgi:kanamycin kinase